MSVVVHVRTPSIPNPVFRINGTPVDISALMGMLIQIGDFRKSVMLSIVYDLAVLLIIGMAYQDRLTESNQYNSCRLKPINRGSIVKLDTFASSVCTLESPDDAQREKV